MKNRIMIIAAVFGSVLLASCGSNGAQRRYETYDQLLTEYAVLAINEFNFRFQAQGRMDLYDINNVKIIRKKLNDTLERVVLSFPHKSHKDYYVYCVLELENGFYTRTVRRAYCTIDIDNPKHPVFLPDDELNGECLMCDRPQAE